MRVVADTGPLLSAADRRDPAHGLSDVLVTALGADLLVLDVVAVEADHLLRARMGSTPARELLAALSAGEHTPVFLTPGLIRRATAIDAGFADLNLGLADAAVMAYAERHDLPVLTFDFEHFRATTPERGTHWRLVVDERRYRDSLTR